MKVLIPFFELVYFNGNSSFAELWYFCRTTVTSSAYPKSSESRTMNR